MDRPFAMLPDAEDMIWGSNRGMAMAERSRGIVTPPSPRSADIAWNDSGPRPSSQNGQLSPVSTGMESAFDNSCIPSMSASTAASTCNDSWSSGTGERDDMSTEMQWEQQADDMAIVPKLEPLEENISFDELAIAPSLPSAMGDAHGKQKRPRGRPRKHPLTPMINASKITKGRSKTGCITCRKRKKKCDEAKPRCMNCEKNAVVCEGYHEKQLWRSGREKAEEGMATSHMSARTGANRETERLRREVMPVITMQPIFHGVETVEDRIFWRHYITHFSNVLTVESEAKNAFKDLILHLANQHQGLMHSLLSVSSKHIDLEAPYGQKLLQTHVDTSREALHERSVYHHDEAMKRFHEDMKTSVDKDDPEYHTKEYQTLLCARYGQILFFLLGTITDGNPRGEHRLHLQAYKTLREHCPPLDPVFSAFVTEIFQYHIFADDLLWHPHCPIPRLAADDWEPPEPVTTPRLMGVADGLFRNMSCITTLRHTIREQIRAGVDPPVDYIMLFQASEIDNFLRAWKPMCPPGDSRNRVGLLYQQMMWVYLYRTIYPPSNIPVRRCTLASLPVTMMPSPASSLPTPTTPQRRASMVASVVPAMSGMNGQTRSCPSSRHPSRTSSLHETDSGEMTPVASASSTSSAKPASPPPKRRPAQDDRRLHITVEEALRILESFSPSDPAQTLLLVPCLVIGIACLDVGQQDRVRKAVKAVRGYTGLRNCDRVSELLEEIWGLMQNGDWITVWDFQTVARRVGIDSLCT